MRALTAEEADILRGLACDVGPGIEWSDDDPRAAELDEVHRRLLLRGCVSHEVAQESDEETGDDYEVDLYSITDLGRLALRVSVPGAGLPL